MPRLREYLLDTAATHNIPYQYFVSKGGTDAGRSATTNNGVPSTVIGVCGRYIHTHQTMFSIADYEAARKCCYKHYVAWINQQLIQLFTESRGCLNDLSQFIRRTSNLC